MNFCYLYGYLFIALDMWITVDVRGHVLPHNQRMELESSRILQDFCNKKISRCEHQPPGYEENTHDHNQQWVQAIAFISLAPWGMFI